ncbi:cytochrome c3 family protein [Desulfopila inferna]|uniref:cytochrome c3 family protein n=1 Tax=Desulfopila inferna TaxID=468528 RepID=UPI0019666CCB|nr:NapC/NirT family cytochrome c [Desulfopila inferna]MBM9605248.1 NapC/NirT family cytochrome c [Desulfopila inferna]
MAEKIPESPDQSEKQKYRDELPLLDKFGLSVQTPLGLIGIALTTICFLLTLLGMVLHATGLMENAYAAIVTFLVFPAGAVLGLLLIPVSAYFRRKKWFGDSINKPNLIIDFGKKKHRQMVILVIVLSLVNIGIFSLVIYQAYHFTESDYFCGVVCHSVMEPEYTAYQRSPHAKVGCVSCHIGSGAEWYVKAKLSGLRQVNATITGDYNTPIPAPVEHLRPARDTCEECHWPEKFHGKMVKEFVSFSNDDQQDPLIDEVALHIGGRNPITERFEGIHWHVSDNVKVEYESLNEKRTEIGRVKVTRPSGITEEFSRGDTEPSENQDVEWRTMDCIDCHNRPAHIYDNLEETVDFGLQSEQIEPSIEGIREDSITVLQADYVSRAEAREQIIENLLLLQAERNGSDFVTDNRQALLDSGAYLLKSYLGNIWPRMDITWGTYKSHLGHQFEDEGYGCFRCHNEEHETEFGKTISQSCDLCHDYPE